MGLPSFFLIRETIDAIANNMKNKIVLSMAL